MWRVSLALLVVGGLRAEEPFRHEKHAPLKLKCVYCHAGALEKERAGFPALARCKSCHPDMAERKIPSRVFFELPDFVQFSHGVHATAKVECSGCHDLAVEPQPVKMKWCVDCHKQRQATVKCTACHELGQ